MKLSPSPSSPLPGILAATIVGLLPVISGLAVMRWHVDRGLTRDAQHIAAEAVRQVDNIIDQAAQSATRLFPLAGQTCDRVVQQMHTEVTLEPVIRSANLVRDNQGYCSTFYGPYDSKVNPDDYLNGQLWLRANNPVTPDRASLVYRLAGDELAVRTVIDGRTLARALEQIEENATLVLEVGNAFLWSNGSVEGGEIPDHPEHHTLLMSARYGYQVHTGYPEGHSWRELKTQGLATLGGLLLLGVLTGGVCHWLYRRPVHTPPV